MTAGDDGAERPGPLAAGKVPGARQPPYSNEKSTIVLVNAGRVNAGPAYFLPATFCVIFRDSGRILDSRNPVKYSRKSRVNPKTA
jgi:hypothetical protein